MKIRSVEFDGKILKVLDQRYLPFQVSYINCTNEKDVWEAINLMKIRGAPAIGVIAAYGMYFGIRNFKGSSEGIITRLKEVKKYLDSARPTAVNLQWATERVLKKAIENSSQEHEKIISIVLEEAKAMENEDAERNFKIGEFGVRLVKSKDTIMTICNTGELATVRYGTAFCVIKKAFEKFQNISVIALETRPHLQGARLTAFELKEAGIPFKLITDNMSAYVMSQNIVNLVIAGADRIALNGDTANKIGTYMLAVLANYHKIPFYIAAPVSTIDPNIRSGKEIPIEERCADEVTHCLGHRIAPENIEVLNPSFDVTPNELITAIITDKGILTQPFKDSIKKVLE